MLSTLHTTLCLAAISWRHPATVAFSSIETGTPIRRSALDLESRNRRTFLVRQIIAPTIASVAATWLPTPRPALADAMLLMDKGRPDVPPFKGSADEARTRLQLAIRDIDNLLENYDTLTRSGGDNVRLYLGTQGVKSNMFGIMKVLNSLKEELEDIVEYTEGKG